MDSKTSIGDRISELRGNLSREAFAAKIAVSKNTLVNYENNTTSPTAAVLNKILVLKQKTSPTWLLTGIGPQTKKDIEAPGELSFSLLAQILEAIEEHLEESGLTLPPEKKARLACALYELVVDKPEPRVERSVVRNLIKLAA